MGTEAVLMSLAMAVAAGLVGCFTVMRRMSLAADALSHVALPGIGVALALHIHPIFGAAAMLFFGALLIWAMESRARIATETVIGVVFSAALAIGSMVTSGEDLIEALFGGAGTQNWSETLFGVAASAAVIAFVVIQRNKLVITMVSRDVARTAGINVKGLELAWLITFAMTIALGLRYLGVLLMGALIIIPAATAKRMTRNLSGMLVTAVALAVASTLAGTLLAARLHRETGSLIVTVAAGFFLLSLLRR
ncbi:MAG TPA: metal ABC transporter permease [Bryobacteraceae bacterium]|jgi:zinc transport system permease protein|nr:metal ABC transporter permease [Bryobacteraceae bacterium]